MKWIFVPVGANVRRILCQWCSYWHKIQRSRRAKWGKKTSRLAVNTGSKTFCKTIKAQTSALHV